MEHIPSQDIRKLIKQLSYQKNDETFSTMDNSVEKTQNNFKNNDILFQMQHFQPGYVQPLQITNGNSIEIFSLNVCTLTPQKFNLILDFLKDKRNFIYIVTETNLQPEKFEKIKKQIGSDIKYATTFKKLNRVNGGILALWSNNLKIKKAPGLIEQNDFRTLFLEFNPNADLKILIAACYLPTINHQEWQNIENLHPDISEAEIRENSDTKEQEQSQNKLKNILMPGICEYTHKMLIGDMNLHQVSLLPQEQLPQLVQKNAFNQFINPCRMRMNPFDANNELNFTQFKDNKNSLLDYIFTSENMADLVEKTQIANDAMIKTDHNLIRVKINLESHQTINEANINRDSFLFSGQLRNKENIVKQVDKLKEIDITSAKLKDFIQIIKKPLLVKVKKKFKTFQINDATTKKLRKIKKFFMKNKRQNLAALVTLRMKKQVNKIRSNNWNQRLKLILKNKKENLRCWWKLITRQMKPRHHNGNLRLNDEGQEDVDKTLEEVQTFFKNLQQRKIYQDNIEPDEDWYASFIVKYQPIGAFQRYQEFTQQAIARNETVDTNQFEIFIGILNAQYDKEYTLDDIQSARESAKSSQIDAYYKPFNGLKITEEELSGQIKDMKVKAPGQDCVDALVLKALPKEQVAKLAELQNELLDHSQIDDDLKNVIVTLLNKTDSPNPSADQFRPLSLLSVISHKAIERCILRRLDMKSNFQQFGFKPMNSTGCLFRVFKEVLEDCKKKQTQNEGAHAGENAIGLYQAGMQDYQKAFNNINMLRLIAKMDNRGVDKNLLALIINMFMAQKVYFKIGDHLTKDPIKFNVQFAHQGSCFSPFGWAEQIFDFIDESEKIVSNLLSVDINNQRQFCNAVLFADDQNENKYQKLNTSQNIISEDIRLSLEKFKQKSTENFLSLSSSKCKHLTNDVSKLREIIGSWTEFEIINSTKLVGIRFKIQKNLELNFGDQFKHVIEKISDQISKLKIAQYVNKHLTARDACTLFKAYIVSICDYNNSNIVQSQAQIKKIDSVMFKSLKHILGFRQTCLTLNFIVCFSLPGFSIRQRIGKFFFLLKHFDSVRPENNACTMILHKLQNRREMNHILEDLLGDLSLKGFKENLLDCGYIPPENDFNDAEMNTLVLIETCFNNSKNNIFKQHIQGKLRSWIKQLFMLKLVVEQFDYEGEFSIVDMKIAIWTWKFDTMGVEQLDGGNFLINHTFWQVLKYQDFFSKNNCIQLNNQDRRLDKRQLKMLFCGYRLGQRVRVFTKNISENYFITSGACNICFGGHYEDELHFIKQCSRLTHFRQICFNNILPITNFKLTYEQFQMAIDMFCFASQEMLSLLFNDEQEQLLEPKSRSYSIQNHTYLNLQMKEMLNDMLNYRKDLMTEIALEDRIDIYPEQIEEQKQWKDLYEWKY